MRRQVAYLALVACHSPSSGAGDEPDAPMMIDAPVMPDAPPQAIPIKHVVVVIKENHTFDNYFGSFPGADGISQITTNHGVITPPHAPQNTPRDLCHDHPCALVDWAGGANNGWDLVDGASQN